MDRNSTRNVPLSDFVHFPATKDFTPPAASELWPLRFNSLNGLLPSSFPRTGTRMDRNSFSIIIPMIGREQSFDDTLASVLRSQPSGSQIIVAHDGSYTDPYDLRREVTFVKSDSSSDNIAALLNAAIKVATCPLTAIVRPGIEAPENWSEPVFEAFKRPAVGSVAGPIVNANDSDRVLAGGVDVGPGMNRKLAGVRKRLGKRATQRLNPLGPTLWAGFYRTSVLQTVAPLCEQMDANYVDADLALAAGTLGMSCHWLPEVIFETSDSNDIQKEARLPHGRSAQRAYRRHGLSSGIAQRVFRSGIEALAATVIPGSLSHALGRLFAGQRRVDASFHARISGMSESSEQRSTLHLSGTSESRDVAASTRRAA
jgi:hypothetical protein